MSTEQLRRSPGSCVEGLSVQHEKAQHAGTWERAAGQRRKLAEFQKCRPEYRVGIPSFLLTD